MHTLVHGPRTQTSSASDQAYFAQFLDDLAGLLKKFGLAEAAILVGVAALSVREAIPAQAPTPTEKRSARDRLSVVLYLPRPDSTR